MKTVISFLLIFTLIVVVHEFGHYFIAKKAGVLVREFSVGMGPKIFQRMIGETTYTIRLLPVGGYVRLAGMGEDAIDISPGQKIAALLNSEGVIQKVYLETDDASGNFLPITVQSIDLEEKCEIKGFAEGDSESKTFPVQRDAFIVEPGGLEVKNAPIERQYGSVSVLKRIAINIAGPVQNFILGIILFILVAFLSGGIPSSEPIIGEIDSGSPAEVAGLTPNDRIEKINDDSIHSWNDMTSIIHNSADKELEITYQTQDNQEKVVTVIPESTEIEDQTIGLIGIRPTIESGLLQKVSYGFKETWSLTSQLFTTILGFFTGGFSLNSVGGPVAMYAMTEQVSSYGFISLVSFTAFLSINLGMMNMIPIPALDGGKIVLNLYELFRGKPLAKEKEFYITAISAVFLIVLMILVTWNDFMKFF